MAMAGMMGSMGGGGGGGGGGMMQQMGQMMMKMFTGVIEAMASSKFAKNIKGVNEIVQGISKMDFQAAIMAFLKLTGVIDMLTLAIEPFLVLLDPVRALFEIMGASIAKELYPVMVAMIPKIMELAPKFAAMGQEIGEFLADFLESDFIPLLEKFLTILPELIPLVFELVSKAVYLFDAMVGSDMLTTILDMSLNFLQYISDNSDSIMEFVDSFSDFCDFIVDNKDTLIEMMKTLKDILQIIIDAYNAISGGNIGGFGAGGGGGLGAFGGFGGGSSGGAGGIGHYDFGEISGHLNLSNMHLGNISNLLKKKKKKKKNWWDF